MGQDIFEKKIVQIYENCKGAVGVADDVQVFGNEETHDGVYQEAIECMEKTGIMHSFDKCIMKTKCCSFFWWPNHTRRQLSVTWVR